MPRRRHERRQRTAQEQHDIGDIVAGDRICVDGSYIVLGAWAGGAGGR